MKTTANAARTAACVWGVVTTLSVWSMDAAAALHTAPNMSSQHLAKEQIYDPAHGWVDEEDDRISAKDRLRETPVVNVSLHKAELREALGKVLQGTGLKFVVEGSDAEFGTISATTKINDSLERVLDEMAETMGFFYRLEGDTVSISRYLRISIVVPSDATSSFVNDLVVQCTQLGAKGARFIDDARTVEMDATRNVSSRIHRFIHRLGSDGTSASGQKHASSGGTEQGGEAMVAAVNRSTSIATSAPSAPATRFSAEEVRPVAEIRTPAFQSNVVPAPTATVLPSVSEMPTQWAVAEGATFKETLRAWALSANWKFYSEPGIPDVRLRIGHVFRGTMADAVSGLVAAIRLDPQIRVTLLEGNSLIHVHPR